MINKTNKLKLYIGIGFLLAFTLWTIALCFIDVKQIGPHGSYVGFSSLNLSINRLIGTHMLLYVITDWLGLIPVFCCLSFAIVGVLQWIKRKNVFKVDRKILTLGAFYIIVALTFVLFEKLAINYRPILINGILEASYPSSTTLLVGFVMPTTIMQFNCLIKNKTTSRCIAIIISIFTCFMIIGRLLSGVHWFTDIIGGILLSAGFVAVYSFVANV